MAEEQLNRHRKPIQPKDHRPQSFKEYLKFFLKKFRLIKWILFIILLIVFVMESYLVYVAKTTDVSNLQQRLQTSTVVYDREGAETGKLSTEKGTYVTLDNISKNVQNAVVSTEDKRFYHHHGFDIIGIARATVGLLIHRDVVGGGSTITQQLVKNSFLSSEQSLTRKLKELFISIEVEKTYTKDQILEMYLNRNYFGNGVYGVEDASEKYFGQSVKDLSLSNAAVLAGALKGPSYYNPLDNYQETLTRRNLILNLMVENGYITQDEANASINQNMPQENNPVGNQSTSYSYYFDAVIAEAESKYGISEDDLMNGGYQIYTNLNQNYQKQLQSVYNNTNLFPTSKSGDVAQSASIALDPYNGGVLAVVGGTGDYTFRGFDRATQMKRQPGSTIKPLNVYTPALENGYTPYDTVPDQVQSYGTDNYTPENHDKVSVGEIKLWQALAQSKNTTAVWLMNKIGVSKAMSQLKAFGIPYTDSDIALSSALGGLENGVSPMQMASAYTAFVNDGKRSEPYFITKILDANGKEVVSEQTAKQTQVMSADTARTMTSMMLAVYGSYGTGAGIMPSGYTIAGKTGTVESLSNNIKDGVNDEWYIAYTPDMVVATWYGFDQSSDTEYLWNYSPVQSKTSFSRIMQSLINASPKTAFTVKSITDTSSSDTSSQESGRSLIDSVKDNLPSRDEIEGLSDKVINFFKKIF